MKTSYLVASIIATAMLVSPWAYSAPGRTAGASITVYTDPQSFFHAAGVVSTETFDELPSLTIIGVGSVTLDEITYTSADTSAEWFIENFSANLPSLPNGLTQRNVIAPAKLTFAAGGHTNAIGFFLIPGGAFPPSDYRFDVTTSSGKTLSINSGNAAEGIFIGFVLSDDITKNGIESLVITPLEGNGGILNFTLDNVSHGIIYPTTNDQCKNDGWKAFGFKNQGQCIQCVNTGKCSF